MELFVGVDLGGTSLRAAVVDTRSGRIIRQRKTATPGRGGPQSVMATMIALITQVAGADDAVRIDGAGIGIPGLVDMERGVATLLPNIPGDWASIALADELRRQFGWPVFLINDVRAMTLAEWTFGAGRGVDTMACYAIGTGIGGGVIVNGQLHLGISGSAGELGHQVVELDGLPCNCGGRGCLEMYASGPAIAARAAQAVIQRRPTCMAAMVNNDINRISAEVVLQAALAGDPVAQSIFAQAGAYIGQAVANTIVTISPRKVVIGGGVSAAGNLLLDPVRAMLRERVHLVPVEQAEILQAQLGDDAGLIGAALWASTQWHS